MNSIDHLFQMLHAGNEEEVQKAGIEEGKKVKFLSIFFQPIEEKAVWENCAAIIAERTDAELSRYVWHMLQWLKDMNWPGATVIWDRLSKMPPATIAYDYSDSLKTALQTEDSVWTSVLKDFVRMDHPGLLEFLPEEQKVLFQAEKN